MLRIQQMLFVLYLLPCLHMYLCFLFYIASPCWCPTPTQTMSYYNETAEIVLHFIISNIF